jgi:hypothetical protein
VGLPFRRPEAAMQTKDIDKLIDAVSKVYCDHSVRVTGRPAASTGGSR